MGYRLEKERTGSTPYVLIDEDSNYMKFEGKSFLENVSEFYRESVQWLGEYLATDFEAFTFDCELVYFNSSTTKLLFKMLKAMDKAAGSGKKVTVNWIAAKDNDIILEYAEDIQEEMDYLDFNLILK